MNNDEMATMPIKKLSIKVATPMVLSMISVALYGIVDAIFISKINSDALTAIYLAMPVQAIITAIGLGTGIGVNALLAKTLGEKNKEKANKIICNGFTFIILSWLIVFLVSFFGVNIFYKFFTDNEVIRALGNKYLTITAMFSIFNLTELLLEKILEAHGKTKSSLALKFTGAVTNLVLDPILIFGLLGLPAFGITGAAIATIFGQFCGMMVGFIALRKHNLVNINTKDLKINSSIAKDVYKVGLPSIILDSLDSLITLMLNKVLITFSASAVNVWGIYGQLQKFIIIIVYGLNFGMIPIIAYNWGAKNKERIIECIKFFAKLIAGETFIGMLVFLLIPTYLVSMYDSSKEIMTIAVPAFRILSIGFVFAGLSVMLSGTCQAFGKGMESLLINLCRKIIFVIPIIFILKPFAGIYSIWIAFTIGEILTTIVAYTLYKKRVYNDIITKIK